MAPKTKEQFAEIRQQSIAAIKQAALELFALRGFASTSISEIAKEAGISKGLLYNYFSGKDQLLHEIVLDAAKSMEQTLMEKLQTADTAPAAQLTAFVEAVFVMVKGNFHYWKLLSTMALQPTVLKDVEEDLMPTKDAMLELIKSLFEQLGSEYPEKEAYLFGATLDGILMHYMAIEEEYPLEEMKEFFIHRFCEPHH